MEAIRSFLWWLGSLMTCFAVLRQLDAHCVVTVPANSAATLMNKWGGKIRAVNAGWHLKLPWEVVADSPVKLASENASFATNVIFGDSDSNMSLKVSFFRTPASRQEYLINYFRIDPKTRESAAIDRVRSVVQMHLQQCKSLEDFSAKHREIEKAIEKEVSGSPGEVSDLEKRIGEIIDRLTISDPEPPQKVIDAEAERDAQKAVNERKRAEAENLQAITRKSVEDSKVNGVPTISHEKAHEQTLAQFGNGSVKLTINKEEKTFGLDGKNRELAEMLINKLGDVLAAKIGSAKRVSGKEEGNGG